MTIEIKSKSNYAISSENYTVEIKKDNQDILNEDNLKTINQALSQAYRKSF